MKSPEPSKTKKAGSDPVKELAANLDSWAKTLPDTQQALLRELLGRSERQELTIGDGNYTIETSLEQAVIDALAPARVAPKPPKPLPPKGWVRGGPLWARWSSRQY
jgi:hypothetical protein